jgi:hypothetical protein
MKNVGLGILWPIVICYLRLFGYIFWLFGNLVVYFPRFGIFYREQSGNPAYICVE